MVGLRSAKDTQLPNCIGEAQCTPHLPGRLRPPTATRLVHHVTHFHTRRKMRQPSGREVQRARLATAAPRFQSRCQTFLKSIRSSNMGCQHVLAFEDDTQLFQVLLAVVSPDLTWAPYCRSPWHEPNTKLDFLRSEVSTRDHGEVLNMVLSRRAFIEMVD